MGLNLFGVAVIAVYLACVTAFGMHFKKKQSGGMVCGFALNIFLWQFTGVPYTWYVPLGSIATFAIGYGASFFLRRTMPVEPVSEVRA